MPTTTIVRSLVIVGVVTGILIVALEVLKPGDNTETITHILGFAGTIEVGLLAYLNSRSNTEKIETTHKLVNGRLSSLIDAAREEGAQAVRDTQRRRGPEGQQE